MGLTALPFGQTLSGLGGSALPPVPLSRGYCYPSHEPHLWPVVGHKFGRDLATKLLTCRQADRKGVSTQS